MVSKYEIEKRINRARNIVELKKELIEILSDLADEINQLDNRTFELRGR